MTITLRELHGEAELQGIYAIVGEWNTGLGEAEFRELLGRMLPLGYRCLAAFDGDTMVGICGFWTRVQFWNRGSLQIDNLIIASERRSEGIGRRLMARVEEIAHEMGCRMVELDSYTHNHDSHRFYFREGYVILGYHFTKEMP